MLKKSIVFTLLLFLAYTVGIGFWRRAYPNARTDQYGGQNNLIKIEKVFSGDLKSVQGVLIGTSLTARMISDSLPEFFNLSMEGQGISEGLQLLNKSDDVPKVICIEMNFIHRLQRSTITYPDRELSQLKRVLPSIREENQPVGLVKPLINAVKLWIRGRAATLQEPRVTDEFLADNISRFKVALAIDSDEASLRNAFQYLKSITDPLEKKGHTLVFFEMPMHPELCKLPVETRGRELFNQNYPPSRYLYVPTLDCADFRSSDGLHLGKEEALRYTLHFREFVGTHLKNR